MPKKLTLEERLLGKRQTKHLKKIVKSPIFVKRYALLCLAILISSTILWSLLSARVQQGNADQTVNALLFQHATTFRGALLPGQHSFLLKWPFFLLIKLFGYSPSSYELVTVSMVLATVLALAAIVWRIDRRPLVFGTFCLAISSMLLLVPPQPYAGGLLPINMAMTTTRNLEYIVFIVSLLLFAHVARLKDWKLWTAIGLLSLLIASDKLFLTLAVGGAILMAAVYGSLKRWHITKFALGWLGVSIAATAVSFAVLKFVNLTHLTHIVNQTGATPYALVRSLKDLLLGGLYGVLGLLTNFGANPAFDATIVRDIPHQLLTRLLNVSGPTFLINAALLGFGGFAIYRLWRLSIAQPSNKKRNPKPNPELNFAIMLVSAALVSVLAFVFSNHYFAVDARYLTVSFFAVVVAIAVFSKTWRWPPEQLVAIGVVLAFGVLLGLFTVVQNYDKDQNALATVNQRNQLVLQILDHHPVTTLVGDYWRVIPIKQLDDGDLDVTPLATCTGTRNTLTSLRWQPNLRTSSFAYLLSLEHGLTDYPNCSLDEVVAAYGRPNTSQLIAGSLDHPQEILLFYDHGANQSAPSVTLKTPSTVLPITPDQLPYTACKTTTIMNVVAHQDDDLLFMNPDLQRDLNSDRCVRTVYVTAGDSGAGQFYWLGREQGSEAAYDAMDGPQSDVWIKRIVKLNDHQFITVANPRGNPRVSLIFMHLPDGNLNGQGFKASHYESLVRLEEGRIKAIHSVDGQSSYTPNELITALEQLMQIYRPVEIHTQANFLSSQYPDHSDHMTVGRDVKLAAYAYKIQLGDSANLTLKLYIGYPIHAMPANVFGDDLLQKETAFFDYAQFDTRVCQSLLQCSRTPTYGAYLDRQYQSAY